MIRHVAFLKAFTAGALGAAIWELCFRLLSLLWPLHLDITRMLGTMVLPSPSLGAWAVGLSMHLVVGGVWAIFYAYFFWSVLKKKPAVQGLIFSFLPAVAAGVTLSPQMTYMHPLMLNHTLESPHFFGWQWGWEGPLSLFGFHFIYGWVMGSLYHHPVGYPISKEKKLLRWKPPSHPFNESLKLPETDSDFIFCTGIECSYPTIEKGRWRMDEMDLTRHYQMWEKDFELVAQMGIRYLRYGPPLHWIFRGPGQYDWSFLDAAMERMRILGIAPILDLCHFGLPAWLGDFQNPEFPKYLAEYAHEIALRYPWVRYWNPVNEIYVAARESTLQGNWNEAEKSEAAFVRATSHMVKASHLMMKAILSLRSDAVFITSESSEFYQACCPDPKITSIANFENQRRFIATDLLYSHPVQDSVKEYLFKNGMTPAEYDEFMGANLSNSMIMGLDYYEWNEKLINTKGEVERLGELFGWYVITKQYYDRYKRPLFHSETNSQDAQKGPAWLWRQWHNINLLIQEGIPVLGFTWYSLQDQVDWDIGISAPLGNINPVGLFDLNREARDAVLAYRQILKMYTHQKVSPELARAFHL